MEFGIPIVPNLAFISSIEKAWHIQVKELESLHLQEVLELITDHVILVLDGQGGTEYLYCNSSSQMSKLCVGPIFVASIIYGFVLHRVYQQYHLERA